ncbi:MAG: hypothetical protein HYZ47_03750 [Simkania negevensis]|nr:hypothetical protein [Simkania negevensis]
MKSLLIKIFINNWTRKLLSIILAIIVWLIVNKSLTDTETITNVAVRIFNIPPGKTIEGLESDGTLNKRVNLTITGKKSLLENLSSNNIEVVFDAKGKQEEWIVTITKNNIRSTNPELNISQGISRVQEQNFIIKLSNLLSEKIAIHIAKPIGEAPKGYQFLDIWPYELSIVVTGPENIIKKLKKEGLKLTFNLNDIAKGQLDDLNTSPDMMSDVISFFIPEKWKQISLPLLSSVPLEINDSRAKYLRIDFSRHEVLKLPSPLPVSLYFPPNKAAMLHPQKVQLLPNQLLHVENGLKVITKPLYAKGVSSLFLETVKDMVQIIVVPDENEKGAFLNWYIQFVNPKELEDRYVQFLLADISNQEVSDLRPGIRQEYLRNRFRNYMYRFELYQSETERFELSPFYQGNSIVLTEKKAHEA